METVIDVRNLTKSYQDFVALHPLDFSLKRGEICAVIGKNGAGKSTFFKILSGQIEQTGGEMTFFSNHTEVSLNRSRKRMGFMIEEPTFFSNMNAYENLNYFRIQRGISEKERINDVLRIVGLSKNPKKKFREYSMGMRQRLGLALTLMSSPDCLVLDEPTNGLDAQGISDIRNLLLKLNKEQDITILISSHILSELQLVATSFLFIDKGKVVEQISRQQLNEKSKKYAKIIVADAAKAAQVLEMNFDKIDYRVMPDNELRIMSHIDHIGEINKVLLSHDINVNEIKVESLNLEEYFLGLGDGL
ncbi:ABC transporter ATP-binding protein [Macrococcus hajekii]|uniref:ABC transporter ATP-binding protein n=1 Tax=Macrococcus hajekii TaxID=198482 RepID=A0A4V3BE54_9STAP|nr:ABC transporter ATP-binding protein [Macrococcus hajekii]TDM02755.1 ABC transporter ATP-binding protein [Macrococcus hajekii]GGB03619.1 bacitracin ABC transporter ATP-binding protein [Macrococcus hajekii]